MVAGVCVAGRGLAAEAGQFVIPLLRGDGAAGVGFAYWDLFLADGGGFNFGWENPPGLLGGEDASGQATTLGDRVGLTQTGTASAFVTGSGAIYSFSEATAFRVDYEATGGAPVTNVVFQTQTGGRRFDIGNIRLEYYRVPGNEESLESVAPNFKALDDPQSGAFAERLVSAFQWDLTGREVGDFRLVFGSPGSSMPLWEAQLDVVEGSAFRQELGHVLVASTRPALRFQRPGRIEKNVPVGGETRFHLPGTRLSLTGLPTAGFAHAGWHRDGAVEESAQLEVIYEDSDIAVTAIFAPLDFATWRTHWFDHANAVLGSPADHLNDAVSGPTADPEGDGADNFTEFAFGGDPYLADPRSRGLELTIDAGGPHVTYRQPASAEVRLGYQLVASDDLANWQPVASTVVNRVLETSGYWRVTVRPSIEDGATAKPFLKIIATPRS